MLLFTGQCKISNKLCCWSVILSTYLKRGRPSQDQCGLKLAISMLSTFRLCVLSSSQWFGTAGKRSVNITNLITFFQFKQSTNQVSTLKTVFVNKIKLIDISKCFVDFNLNHWFEVRWEALTRHFTSHWTSNLF
jgi:hypothetical protein